MNEAAFTRWGDRPTQKITVAKIAIALNDQQSKRVNACFKQVAGLKGGVAAAGASSPDCYAEPASPKMS